MVRSFRQEAIGAPRSKRLVKRDQNPLSFLSKCEQPCIGPKFGRCRSPRGFLTKPLLYLWGFGDKRYTVVFVQAVVDPPCCGDRQRLAVPPRSCRHETQEAKLRQTRESDHPSLLFPPAPCD